MQTKSSATTPHEIFSVWKEEDRELEKRLDFIREWMLAVGEAGVPRFSETATRLTNLRSHLVRHFQREDELSHQLTKFYKKPCPEIEAMQRQAARDHLQLLGRLDELVKNLNASEPPFDSWRAAIDQFDGFIGALEQHEEQESESFCAMMPSAERMHCKD